jgi:hypothetical protein
MISGIKLLCLNDTYRVRGCGLFGTFPLPQATLFCICNKTSQPRTAARITLHYRSGTPQNLGSHASNWCLIPVSYALSQHLHVKRCGSRVGFRGSVVRSIGQMPTGRPCLAVAGPPAGLDLAGDILSAGIRVKLGLIECAIVRSVPGFGGACETGDAPNAMAPFAAGQSLECRELGRATVHLLVSVRRWVIVGTIPWRMEGTVNLLSLE